MTIQLKLSTGSFDQDNSFAVEYAVRGRTGRKTCSLQRDYKERGDGIFWGLSSGVILKDSYTAADVAERERLDSSAPVRDGDVVTIEGKQYRAKVNGPYSDAVDFTEVAA